MADPLIEDVEEELKNLLDGVTTANGYQFDITAHRPKNRNTYAPADSVAVLQWQGAEPSDDLSAASNPAIKGWIGTWTIDLFVAETEASTNPFYKRLHQMRADVEKAIAIGLNADSTLDGLVETWEIVGAEMMTHQSGVSGVRINVELGFRHSENDPYKQR